MSESILRDRIDQITLKAAEDFARSVFRIIFLYFGIGPIPAFVNLPHKSRTRKEKRAVSAEESLCCGNVLRGTLLPAALARRIGIDARLTVYLHTKVVVKRDVPAVVSLHQVALDV